MRKIITKINQVITLFVKLLKRYLKKKNYKMYELSKKIFNRTIYLIKRIYIHIYSININL